MRVCVDSSVLFLAANSSTGRAAALVRLSGTGRFSLCASAHAIERARRNLATRARDRLDELESLLEGVDRLAEAPAKVVAWAQTQALGPGDAPVLAAAVAAGVDGLVSADRTAFGHLFGKKTGDVTVASLHEALRYFLERKRD
jgi:predicted nucleic acid-binding protein